MQRPASEIFAILAFLAIPLLFIGCGSAEDSKSKQTDPSANTEQADDNKTQEDGNSTNQADTDKAEPTPVVDPVDEKELSELKPNPPSDFEWEINQNLVTIIKCKASGTVVLPKMITGFPVGRIGALTSDGNTLPRQFEEANAIPDGVTALVLPESVTSIADGAFYGCNSLVSLTLPDKLSRIGKYAFFGCENLREVTVGSGLSIIDGNAFHGCVRLTIPKLPDSLTQIGQYAFSNCVKFTEINIPRAVNNISSLAFAGCPNLKSITVDEKNPTYASDDGVLLNKTKQTLEGLLTPLRCHCTGRAFDLQTFQVVATAIWRGI